MTDRLFDHDRLDLTPLKNALQTFKNALDDYAKTKGAYMGEYVRDACIKRFEYCYGLAFKFIKRHLQLIAADNSNYDLLSFSDIMREASTRTMIKGEVKDWLHYRYLRNKTSHTYDEPAVVKMLDDMRLFYDEVHYIYGYLSNYYASES